MPPTKVLPLIDRLLGSAIDAAALDGRRTRWLRLMFGVVTAGVLCANLGMTPALAWLAVCCGGEMLGWLSSRDLAVDRAATRRDRLGYLVAVTILTVNWSLCPVLYWVSGRPALQAVAIVVTSSLLIHAQAFAFRSPVLLAINAGIPSAVLVLLVLWFSGLSGPDWVTAAFGVGTALAYVAASARANRIAARRLDESRDELERIAYSDALTSLANRRGFSADLGRLITYSREHGTRFALVLIDLDSFKETNDQLGHAAGDALLIRVARQLSALAGGDDHVARVGGDEFAMLIADATDNDRVSALCEDLLARVATTLDCNGSTLRSTSSIGVAVYPQHGAAEDSLYKAADSALYAAKKGGRNTWRAYGGEGAGSYDLSSGAGPRIVSPPSAPAY